MSQHKINVGQDPTQQFSPQRCKQNKTMKHETQKRSKTNQTNKQKNEQKQNKRTHKKQTNKQASTPARQPTRFSAPHNHPDYKSQSKKNETTLYISANRGCARDGVAQEQKPGASSDQRRACSGCQTSRSFATARPLAPDMASSWHRNQHVGL